MEHPATRKDATRSFWVFALLGVGVMAAIDEIVFHQLLSWHHFYDESSTDVALASDGALHAAELLIIVGSLFLYADLRRREVLSPAWAWSGFFVGMGLFQLFDGIVDHKVLGVHQIRYGVDILPYDLAWNGAAVLLLLIGVALALRARGRAPDEAVTGSARVRGTR